MDKVIAHRFWILFGAALLMALAGWWMGTADLAGEIDKNITEIDTAQKGIPNPADHPNEKWQEALDKINQKWADEHRQAAEVLWNKQQSLMTWPGEVAASLKDVPYLDAGRNDRAKVLFRNAYYYGTDNSVTAVYNLVEPLNPEDGTGKIAFSDTVMPMVPMGEWGGDSLPSWKAMWYAQEDLWLTKALLKAVANVNNSSKSITESPIREILVLQLLAGSRTDPGSAPASGGDSEYGDAMAGGMPGGMPGGMGPGTGHGGGANIFSFGGGSGGFPGMPGMGGESNGPGGLGGGQSSSIDFNPAEELGTPVPEATEDGAAPGPGGSADDMAAMPGENGPGGLGMPGTGQNARKWEDQPRYVDKDPSQPFKTRGFYLKVVMERRKLPEFVAELCRAEFPIRIVRIHQEDQHKNFSDLSVGGGRDGGYGVPGSMPGGAEYGMPGDYPDSGPMGAEADYGPVVPGFPAFGGPGAGGAFGAMPFGFAGRSPAYTGGSTRGSTGFLTKRKRSRTADQVYRIAMADEELAYVVIAGLMTIYQPPPAEEPQPGATGDAAPGGGPGTIPPEDAEPGATPEGPLPSDPAAASPAEPAAESPPESESAQPADPEAAPATAPLPGEEKPKSPKPPDGSPSDDF